MAQIIVKTDNSRMDLDVSLVEYVKDWNKTPKRQILANLLDVLADMGIIDAAEMIRILDIKEGTVTLVPNRSQK